MNREVQQCEDDRHKSHQRYTQVWEDSEAMCVCT